MIPQSPYSRDVEAYVLLCNDLAVAIRQWGHVEVWSPSAEIYVGTLPANATVNDVECAVAFYANGYREGISDGRDMVYQELQDQLGLDNTASELIG